MARRWGRRARWRRWVGRGITRGLVPLGVAGLVAGLLAGGVAEVGRASGPYLRTVDLGYASMATSLAHESASSGAALRSLLATAPSLDRIALLGRAGVLVAEVRDEDHRLRHLVPPAPAAGAEAPCVASFDMRAGATEGVRTALVGLLGGPTGTAAVDAGATLAALQGVANTIVQSDASWGTCQFRLHAAPGAARLPGSSWVTDNTSWSATTLDRLVTAVVRAPALAARHALAIPALTTDPAPLAAGAQTALPPTSSVTVHLVVADQGNVDEPAVQVQVTFSPSPGAGSPQTETAIVTLRAGRSEAVTLGPFSVRQGASYAVQVTAARPQGTGGASTSFTVQVAEVPTTTTTSTTTTTAPVRRRG